MQYKIGVQVLRISRCQRRRAQGFLGIRAFRACGARVAGVFPRDSLFSESLKFGWGARFRVLRKYRLSSPSQVAKGIGVPVGRAIVGKQGILHTGINVGVTSNEITFGDREEWTDKWRTKGHIKWKLDDLEGLVVPSNKRMLVTPTPILRNQEALYDYHGVLPLGAGRYIL